MASRFVSIREIMCPSFPCSICRRGSLDRNRKRTNSGREPAAARMEARQGMAGSAPRGSSRKLGVRADWSSWIRDRAVMMSEAVKMPNRIKSVRWLCDYRLMLVFKDGLVAELDLQPLAGSPQGQIDALLKDVDFFKRVDCDGYTIPCPMGTTSVRMFCDTGAKWATSVRRRKPMAFSFESFRRSLPP